MVMTTTFRNFAHSNSLPGLCTCMPNTFRVLLDVSARPGSRSSSISFRNSTLSLATQVAFLSFHIYVSHKPIYFRLFYYVLYSHSLVKLFFIFFFSLAHIAIYMEGCYCCYDANRLGTSFCCSLSPT